MYIYKSIDDKEWMQEINIIDLKIIHLKLM